mgnify:CR=1 FL=1
MTESASRRNTPHKIGINSSFLISIEITAIKPPTVKLPVSPINTWAGYDLYQMNPIHAPTNEKEKITSLSFQGV